MIVLKMRVTANSYWLTGGFFNGLPLSELLPPIKKKRVENQSQPVSG